MHLAGCLGDGQVAALILRPCTNISWLCCPTSAASSHASNAALIHASALSSSSFLLGSTSFLFLTIAFWIALRFVIISCILAFIRLHDCLVLTLVISLWLIALLLLLGSKLLFLLLSICLLVFFSSCSFLLSFSSLTLHLLMHVHYLAHLRLLTIRRWLSWHALMILSLLLLHLLLCSRSHILLHHQLSHWIIQEALAHVSSLFHLELGLLQGILKLIDILFHLHSSFCKFLDL